MDELKKTESHVISPAAFVEGGIQDACDDACSICLEAFCESDPSTVTSCKHEFHLQCILEWCQRSSNCPMCWQPVSLKDQTSQELLDAVGQERSFRASPARNATIFHHPTLGDFELQHLPVGMNDTELEERIIQHLTAAASMGGRGHHVGRREGSRNRSSTHGRRQFLVFSSHPSASATASLSPSPTRSNPGPAAASIADTSPPITDVSNESPQHLPHLSSVQSNQFSASSSGSVPVPTLTQQISVGNRSSSGSSLTSSQVRTGPSDLQSLSESWKSRLNCLSMKYKESLSKSTRGWKEKLFTRSTSMVDSGSEVRREMNVGIASVSHMMERLETRENSRAGSVSAVTNVVDSSNTLQRDHDNMGTHNGNGLNRNSSTAFAAGSAQN